MATGRSHPGGKRQFTAEFTRGAVERVIRTGRRVTGCHSGAGRVGDLAGLVARGRGRAPSGCTGGEGNIGSVPTFTGVRSTGSASNCTPTASPFPHIAKLGMASNRPSGERSEPHRHSSSAVRPIHRMADRDDSRASSTGPVSTPFCLVSARPSSGGANGLLRGQGCYQPRPRSGVRPALSFSRSLRQPTAFISAWTTSAAWRTADLIRRSRIAPRGRQGRAHQRRSVR